MKRILSTALALVVVGTLAAPTASAEPRGSTRSAVAGGWEGSPPAIPTSIDPETGKFTVVGHAVFNGDWVGVSVFRMTGTVDLTDGSYVATAQSEFTGTWLADQSRGTLYWREAMTGNFITGAFSGTFDIERGTGDRSFRCSSGHFTWSGYSPPAASYGGYSGTWIHGCKD